MTDPQPAPVTERPVWTTPVIEEAGTIHDVAGGGLPGLDTNGFPAHS